MLPSSTRSQGSWRHKGTSRKQPPCFDDRWSSIPRTSKRGSISPPLFPRDPDSGRIILATRGLAASSAVLHKFVKKQVRVRERLPGMDGYAVLEVRAGLA